jgi:hypothetical protein
MKQREAKGPVGSGRISSSSDDQVFEAISLGEVNLPEQGRLVTLLHPVASEVNIDL